MESALTGRGGFFMISPKAWSAACDLGINEAVAFLVLAQGTAGNNTSTSWSAESLHRYAGMAWVRGKAAIERLIQAGLLAHGAKHTPRKPRYEFTSAAEVAAAEYRLRLARLSDYDRSVLSLLQAHRKRLSRSEIAAAERLQAAGLVLQSGYREFVPVKPPAGEDSSRPESEPIWLPNTLITGTVEGETPPIKRIRQNGDIWALRLLVELYAAHNLRDDGGISPAQMWQKFERKVVGRFGAYTVWAFKAEGHWVTWSNLLKRHGSRPKESPDGNHPFWSSHATLLQAGLLSYVPHVWDNDPTNAGAAAEILHPFGVAGSSAEPLEMEIGRAAHQAGMRAAFPEKIAAAAVEGFNHLCPVRSTIQNACMVGVARLRYRPHTGRTGAWIKELKRRAPEIIRELDSIAADRSLPIS